MSKGKWTCDAVFNFKKCVKVVPCFRSNESLCISCRPDLSVRIQRCVECIMILAETNVFRNRILFIYSVPKITDTITAPSHSGLMCRGNIVPEQFVQSEGCDTGGGSPCCLFPRCCRRSWCSCRGVHTAWKPIVLV